jgi:hypothetical protein
MAGSEDRKRRGDVSKAFGWMNCFQKSKKKRRQSIIPTSRTPPSSLALAVSSSTEYLLPAGIFLISMRVSRISSPHGPRCRKAGQYETSLLARGQLVRHVPVLRIWEPFLIIPASSSSSRGTVLTIIKEEEEPGSPRPDTWSCYCICGGQRFLKLKEWVMVHDANMLW